jgi:hypothetical protein
VYINRVLNVINSILKLLLEMLGILVGQFLLVVADGVEHCTELFELFFRSDVQVSQVSNVIFLENIITVIIGQLSFELDVFARNVVIFHCSCLLTLLCILTNLPDDEDYESVN